MVDRSPFGIQVAPEWITDSTRRHQFTDVGVRRQAVANLQRLARHVADAEETILIGKLHYRNGVDK